MPGALWPRLTPVSRWRRQLGRVELRRIKSVHMNERGDELVVVSEGKHRRTVPKKTGKGGLTGMGRRPESPHSSPRPFQ